MGEILSAEEVESFSEGYDAKDVRYLARSHEALRRERDAHRGALRETMLAGVIALAKADAAEAEVTRLREALSRYGCHAADCRADFDTVPCDCGLDAALSAPKEGG